MPETPNTTTESEGPSSEVERLRSAINQAALDLGTETGKTSEQVYRDLVAALSEEGQGEAGHRLSREDGEELWRCPVHGVLEPHKLSGRGWGTGEPGEYGTCPVMLDEDSGCGQVLERPPIALSGVDQGLLKGIRLARAELHRQRFSAEDVVGHRDRIDHYLVAALQNAGTAPVPVLDDDVERLREKLLGEVAVDAASTSFEESEFTTGEFSESAMRDALAAALAAVPPAPDVERLGGEETTIEYRVNEADGIHGPVSHERAVQIHRYISEHEEPPPRPPVIESRCVGAWREINASPPPPQEHFKAEVDAFRELGKRLLGEEARHVAAEAHRKRCEMLHAPTHEETATIVLRAAWDSATAHSFSLPEHSKGGVEAGQDSYCDGCEKEVPGAIPIGEESLCAACLLLRVQDRERDIEAVCWDGSEESQAAIVNWSGGAVVGWFDSEYFLEVRTPTGTRRVVPGDFILRDGRGVFYVGNLSPVSPQPYQGSDQPDYKPGRDCEVRTARKRWECCGNGGKGEGRQHSDGCIGSIEPGDRCVELLDETPAYQSGPRCCLPCAVELYGIHLDQPKDCGGSGKDPDCGGCVEPLPCSGCSHPDCPNRDQPKDQAPGGER